MGLIFSRQCEYALQAIVYLALKQPGKWATIKEITNHLRIPAHFLAKILQNLTKKKVLVSLKGPTGGFSLARPPSQIFLIEVIKAIDGDDLFEKCVMGFPECSPTNPCAVHEQWAELRGGLTRVLETRSMEELAHGMKKPEYKVRD